LGATLKNHGMRYILFIFLCLLLFDCHRQSESKSEMFESPYKDTLIDKEIGLTFYLDTLMINVYAFDNKGVLIWKTDPWKDNNLMEYRVKRPIIQFFHFENNRFTDNKEVIGIGYNNSQFGYLNKLTGEFIFEGQD
jgi:hypothetical protein